jgi:hypothetical protein
MATLEKTVSYAAPGLPGSPVSLKPRYENFIGGKWVPPVHGAYSENLSPVTGEPFTASRSRPGGRRARARRRARAQGGVGGDLGRRSREGAERVAQAIEDNLELLAVAESWENGKPVRETLAADIPLAADHFRYFAGAIRGEEGRSPRSTTTRRLPLPRAARRRRPDHPVQLPAADGGVEDRPGARGRQLHGAQAREPDAVVDPEADAS